MILLILAGFFIAALVANFVMIDGDKKSNSFYVGVTFCGNTTTEAKLLIDKVKNYTNLFILQSGSLQQFPDKINEIGDYAVSSGMYFIVYFGGDSRFYLEKWLETYDGRWGDWFLGVYYGDEPGGNMLDDGAIFWDKQTNSLITKTVDSRGVQISIFKSSENTSITYWPDGKIELSKCDYPTVPSYSNVTTTIITYFPNGTITIKILELGGSPIKVDDNYNVTHTYEELWNARPFQSYDETAERFIEQHRTNLEIGLNQTITAFTSDYALYWFDYLASYDVVLAQFGWNHTTVQDIALIRGAAYLQNKSWGVIITWKYTNPPYLASGEEIYDQMRIAYECGAEYVIIFNYPTIEGNNYGILQDEHFEALERFWNEVVQNPKMVHGGIKAEAALVLPRNYGWGMRHPEDTIWGLWNPDEKAQQIWELLQKTLAKHGLHLDIVYDDPTYPATGKYQQIYYWNQTS
jgi:hypothetical protein